MTFSLLRLLKAFYWPFNGHTIFKSICCEARPTSATLTTNNALKWWPYRGPPPPQAPCVLRSALFCYRLLSENVIRLYQKCFFGEVLVTSTIENRQKCAWPYFHLVANKGLIWAIINTPRINLYVMAIFQHNIKYHGCWWPSGARDQCISIHDMLGWL